MKLVISGSRDIPCFEIEHIIENELKKGVTHLLCGMARGVDLCAASVAQKLGITVVPYIPRWHEYGRKAGVIRNTYMCTDADRVVAIWDGKSAGTAHMIRCARRKEKDLTLYMYSVKDE